MANITRAELSFRDRENVVVALRRRRPGQRHCHGQRLLSRPPSAAAIKWPSLIIILLAIWSSPSPGAATSRASLKEPIRVGLQSALSGSGWPSLTRFGGAKPTRDRRDNSIEQCRAVDMNHQAQSTTDRAHLRFTSPEDVIRQRQASFALLRKQRTSDDELSYLESLSVPCNNDISTQTTVQQQSLSPSLVPAGGAADSVMMNARALSFWETMMCGAVSRSVAQTIMHPANTLKTILQNNSQEPARHIMAHLLRPSQFRRLTVGAGANFLLSIPNGAVNFAVLEFVRSRLTRMVQHTPWLENNQQRLGPGLDFMSSAISTICCSVVATPQMMITDNIMVGNYPNLPAAVRGLATERGLVGGFYRGWWPGLVGKIPSYALTWTFFQQLKVLRLKMSPNRPARNYENSIMGCIASATTVCIMIPLDTIKTRLVTQSGRAVTEGGAVAYKGIIDCAVQVFRHEGMGAFYRGLPPRLVSVVPMIGIQFGVYEAMKRVMLQRRKEIEQQQRRRQRQQRRSWGVQLSQPRAPAPPDYKSESVLHEALMEVAASPAHPFPAPQFLDRVYENSKRKIKRAINGR